MALAPRLELRQRQSLALTPQLQQAIKLLQMSNLELADFVAELAETNPLLEVSRPQGPGSAPPADGPSPIEFIAAVPTLHEHLFAQLAMTRAPRAALAAARAIIGELDDDGYLREPLDSLSERYGLGEAAAEGLALVQGCDPSGIGARGLAECFTLQLRDMGALDPPMERLLDYLDLLTTGRAALAAACGTTLPELAEMLGRLRRLDPKPGSRFTAAPVPVVVPDILVRQTATGWDVELNADTLPRVLVNNTYSLVLGRFDGPARAFISECSAQANWLVRSLAQRARTMLKVAGAIVRHQERFLTDGVAGLRPLSQRALADRVGLHESTVSRVIAGKYLACTLGTFELRFFFSASIQGVEGGDAFAATAVRERIRALIEGEMPPRTLSDDRIVAILHGEGIDVARRTVAKYREVMGIPSSVDRRRMAAGRARRGADRVHRG